MDIQTADLSGFGYREIDLAIELLKAYREQGAENLGDGINLNFNSSSGYVFLSDSDYNVYMMNGDSLEQWFNCSYCGQEGFKEDLLSNHKGKDLHKDCKEFNKELRR